MMDDVVRGSTLPILLMLLTICTQISHEYSLQFAIDTICHCSRLVTSKDNWLVIISCFCLTAQVLPQVPKHCALKHIKIMLYD